MSVIDEMYLKIAEDNLFSELSIALEKTKEEIKKYILTKLINLSVIQINTKTPTNSITTPFAGVLIPITVI